MTQLETLSLLAERSPEISASEFLERLEEYIRERLPDNNLANQAYWARVNGARVMEISPRQAPPITCRAETPGDFLVGLSLLQEWSRRLRAGAGETHHIRRFRANLGILRDAFDAIEGQEKQR